MALTKGLGGSSGGTTITTKDEGSTLSSTVTTLDFVGAGVTATGAGATTTVTIPGGSLTVKDEGSNLSTAVTSIDFVGAGVTATGTTAVTVTIPGASASSRAYWMIFVEATQGAGSNARIGELQLRASSGGSNIATGGTPIYIDQFSSSGDNSASAAFDSNTATSWSSAGTTMPSGVGYQLASASVVNEIVITCRNDGFGPNGAPARFTVLSSSDGVSYQREWSVLLSTGWTAGLSRTFTRPT